MNDPLSVALHGLGFEGPAALAAREALSPIRKLREGERLVSQGDDAAGLHLVLGGVLKSCRNLDNGQAQTLALFTAGETVGVQAVALGREPATLAAVPASRVATLPAARLKRLQQDHPDVVAGLWRTMAREATILQEWMVGMGRRTALSQIAHLLCEMAVRSRHAGRAVGDIYDFPLTQAELADAVGLSPVHVNRILQTLRSAGLIELRRGELRIGDWRRMAETAGFDGAYLDLRPLPGDGHAALLFPPVETRDAGDRRDRQPLPQR